MQICRSICVVTIVSYFCSVKINSQTQRPHSIDAANAICHTRLCQTSSYIDQRLAQTPCIVTWHDSTMALYPGWNRFTRLHCFIEIRKRKREKIDDLCLKKSCLLLTGQDGEGQLWNNEGRKHINTNTNSQKRARKIDIQRWKTTRVLKRASNNNEQM